ncbi:SDR family NAD(P)-dependent oxidoreductase [Tomitella gaofuii]|uniref:SDR family NAD(P)-dependent oxidoreductase n=1 Tax=Tomitella gaofuii TaxID=2760083 RepID=UPI0015FB9198
MLLLGGCSDIGIQVARRIAAATADDARTVVLAARRTHAPERRRVLDAHAEQLRAAGAGAVAVREFDADDLPSHRGFLAAVAREFGTPGVTVLAFGILGDQARAETDSAHAAAILHTDFVAQVSVLTELTTLLRVAPPRGGRRGAIVVFSSVAGVRVRRANYVYGSAKAGLDGYACGLSDALTGSGIDLLLARPGFVVGAMTAGLMADGVKPAPMSSTPGEVADAVVDALARRRRVVWIPGRLRAVFAVARLVPGFVWRRLPR